jgi:hypothetical protein
VYIASTVTIHRLWAMFFRFCYCNQDVVHCMSELSLYENFVLITHTSDIMSLDIYVLVRAQFKSVQPFPQGNRYSLKCTNLSKIVYQGNLKHLKWKLISLCISPPQLPYTDYEQCFSVFVIAIKMSYIVWANWVYMYHVNNIISYIRCLQTFSFLILIIGKKDVCSRVVDRCIILVNTDIAPNTHFHCKYWIHFIIDSWTQA